MLKLLLLSTIIGFALSCKAGKYCHCIESTPGKYVRAWKGPESKDDWYLDIAPHCLDNEHWLINAKNGKVSLKSDDGMYLLAYPNGTVYLSKSASEPEMWETENNEDGSWSLHVDGRYLSAHRRDDTVGTKPHNRNWERFRIHALDLFNALKKNVTSTAGPTEPITITTTTEPPTTETTTATTPKPWLPRPTTTAASYADALQIIGQYRFRSVKTGTYLLVRDMDERVELGDRGRNKENWYIFTSNGNVIIMEVNPIGNYLVDKIGYPVMGNTAEHWTPVKNSDGSFSFQSLMGWWLSVGDDGVVRMDPYQHGDGRQAFWMEPVKTKQAIN